MAMFEQISQFRSKSTSKPAQLKQARSPQEATTVALDLGGQGPAAGLYNHLGDCLEYQERDCRPQISDEGRRVEYNANQYINACVDALNTLQNYRNCADQLQLGIASQGASFIGWNKNNGKALSPIISWQDTRTKISLEQLKFNRDDIESITGLKPSAHYGASKLAWCLEYLPSVRKANAAGELSFGPLNSYLLFILSQGRHNFCDPGCAQRTLLWDIQHNTWSHKLCRQFRIPPTALPQIRQNCDDYGQLNFGYLGRQPLKVTAMHRDQNSSLFADGEINADNLYINLGTGAFVQRSSTNKQPPDGLLISPALYTRNYHSYAWEGTVNGAASALPWLEKQLRQVLSPQRIEWALNRDYRHWQGFFINSIRGLGSPYWRNDIATEFTDMDKGADSSSHDNMNACKITAWIESLIFHITEISILMQAETPLKQVEISGGMAASDALCQRLADNIGLTIIRRQDSEASLRGIAYLAAGRPRSWQARKSEATFLSQDNPALKKRFHRWQQTLHKKTGFKLRQPAPNTPQFYAL